MVKQISGFAVININGGQRITCTYDEINESGDLVSANNKKSFYAVEKNVVDNIEGIMSVIKEKLEE